ncbi:MAG: hypothetical protein PHP22_06740 [Oscillospiraceae bacterium]|nr:hypothetical protein [Oscillospiraceae bacterium]
MRLDEVTSIMQIWEAAKKNGKILSGKDGRAYEYKFESGELVAFSLDFSFLIENNTESFKDYYVTNFHLYIESIKEAHSKEPAHGFVFTNPFPTT